MTKVVYEYKDDSGMVHRVDDVKEVPQKYVKTMTAVGVEEQQQSAGTAAAPSSSAPPSKLPGNIAPEALLIPLALIVIWRTTNFMLRIILVLALLFWGVTHGYELFMNSKYTKTDAETSTNPKAGRLD